MRLLVITDSYPPYHSGGYELRCKDVIDQLTLRGHEIKIITTRKPKQVDKARLTQDNVFRYLHSENNSRSLSRRIFDEYQDIHFIDKVITSFSPDIIYLFHTINLTRTIFPYLADRAIPIVYDEGGIGLSYAYTHHGGWYYFVEHKSRNGFVNFINKHLAVLISRISRGLLKTRWQWPCQILPYFNSELNCKAARDRGLILDHYPVIYSGIDLQRFKYVQHNASTPPITILVPGRLEPQKGQIDSIHLLSILRKTINARVILVGSIRFPTYYDEIMVKAREYALEGFVEILPMKDHSELMNLYHLSSFCFFPSHQQSGFSRTPLEAMACGCVLLSYGNEGSNEILKNHETGFLLSEGDIGEASEIIVELVNNPDVYKRISTAARTKVENEHSMDHYVDQIEKFLFQSIATPSNE